MSTELGLLKQTDFGHGKILEYIANVRNALSLLSDFPVTSFGPSGPSDKAVGVRYGQMTGTQLRRASTNSAQGLWLSKLARQVVTKIDDPINVLELGTAAGISSMYLLAGMAEGVGGHLVTFEGSPELAQLAENHLRMFVAQHALAHVDFEIVIGDFDVTLDPYIQSLTAPLHLVFIDGNHRGDATLRYHSLVRSVMDKRGVIVHDDIGWSDGMRRAWHAIQEVEGAGRTVELHLGNRPSRGIIFLSQDPTGTSEIMHLDGVLERFGRWAKRALKRR